MKRRAPSGDDHRRLRGLGGRTVCGKIGYPTKAAAKKALRRSHPGDKLMREYRCDGGCGQWHLGHAPKGTPRFS